MPESTAREERSIDVEFILGAGLYAADKPIPWVFFPSTTTAASLAEARKRVHRADVAERRALAERFAADAYAIPGVHEVRLTEIERTLVVTVLAEDRDMERDLALQRLFSEIVREVAPGAEWSLRSRLLGYDDDPDVDGELVQT